MLQIVLTRIVISDQPFVKNLCIISFHEKNIRDKLPDSYFYANKMFISYWFLTSIIPYNDFTYAIPWQMVVIEYIVFT